MAETIRTFFEMSRSGIQCAAMGAMTICCGECDGQWFSLNTISGGGRHVIGHNGFPKRERACTWVKGVRPSF